MKRKEERGKRKRERERKRKGVLDTMYDLCWLLVA